MIWIAFALVGAALTLNLHELSHVVVVKKTGGEIPTYAPWPHFRNSKAGVSIAPWTGIWWFLFAREKLDGYRWYNGRVSVRYRVPKGEGIPRSYRYSHVAPLVKALFVLGVWMTLGLTVYRPLLALAVWEASDVVWWWRGYFFKPKTDGWKWKERDV